jgi:hypothetical protein
MATIDLTEMEKYPPRKCPNGYGHSISAVKIAVSLAAKLKENGYFQSDNVVVQLAKPAGQRTFSF